jgi:hypothetical protein
MVPRPARRFLVLPPVLPGERAAIRPLELARHHRVAGPALGRQIRIRRMRPGDRRRSRRHQHDPELMHWLRRPPRDADVVWSVRGIRGVPPGPRPGRRKRAPRDHARRAPDLQSRETGGQRRPRSGGDLRRGSAPCDTAAMPGVPMPRACQEKEHAGEADGIQADERGQGRRMRRRAASAADGWGALHLKLPFATGVRRQGRGPRFTASNLPSVCLHGLWQARGPGVSIGRWIFRPILMRFRGLEAVQNVESKLRDWGLNDH